MSKSLSQTSSLKVSWLLVIVLIGLASCVSNHKISSGQVGQLKIGDPMPGIDARRINGQKWKDTLFSAKGYHWSAIRLVYPGGPVWVEAGFFGEGRINRIRVESPRLKYLKGLRVGDTMADLLALGVDWELSYLPAYDLIDLSRPEEPSVHFLIENLQQDPDFWLSDSASWKTIPLAAQVKAIVVM